MTDFKPQIHLSPALSDREAVTDALYRAILAFDTNDADMLRSAITPDVVFEMPDGPHEGADNIINGIFAHIGKMDTLHLLSNVRVNLTDANTAQVTCSAQAFHYRTGEGLKPEADSFVGGSMYWATAIKAEDGLWKFKHWKLQLVWTEGNFEIMRA